MSELRTLPSPTATQIALRFVGDLQAGRRPSIEAALDAAPSSEWDGLLQSLLIAEVNLRRSRGETPVPREYLPRFPAHALVIESVFTTLLPVGRLASKPAPAPPLAEPAPEFKPSVPVAAAFAPAIISNGAAISPPPLPVAAFLRPAFADLEPPPNPAPARRQRRRRRGLWFAGGIAAVILAGTVGVLIARHAGKPAGPGEPPPPAKGPMANTTPKAHSPFDPKPQPADPEREFADWIVGVGGHGVLAMEGGGRKNFGPDLPLPKAKFAVAGIVLPPESSGRWSAADMVRLRGRDQLTSVELHHPTALGDWLLDLLAGSPLHTLDLHGNAVAVTGAGIARFPELESLTIFSAPAFSDADMSAIGKLGKLTTLSLNAPRLTPAGLGELKKTSLRSLILGESVKLTPDHVRNLQGLPLEEFESQKGMTDDSFLEFAIFQSLKRFRLLQTSITDAGMKVVLGLGMLEELQITGSSIAGPGLENLSDRKSLKILDLSGGKINDEGVGKLLTLPSLIELRLAGCPISDRGVMLLAQVDGVQVLDLSQTNVTNAALGILKKHPTLKTLILTGTRATSAAVNDFERATPNCKVVFGSKK